MLDSGLMSGHCEFDHRNSIPLRSNHFWDTSWKFSLLRQNLRFKAQIVMIWEMTDFHEII